MMKGGEAFVVGMRFDLAPEAHTPVVLVSFSDGTEENRFSAPSVLDAICSGRKVTKREYLAAKLDDAPL